MPTSITDWVLSLLIPVLIVVSGLYAAASILLTQVRRRRGETVPGVYPGSPEHQAALRAAGVVSMADWRALSTVEQEAADNAALDLGEQAELDAEDDAREAAEFLAQRAQANALFHP
jgi:hypothetical protein